MMSTIAAVVLLFSYKTSTNPTTVAAAPRTVQAPVGTPESLQAALDSAHLA
jgi:hypothetical protein